MTLSPAESTNPAAATPTPARGWPSAASRIGLDQGVLDLTYDDAAPGRRAAAGAGDAPLVVDHSREHLGAADVDADVDRLWSWAHPVAPQIRPLV